ncbi:MAG TPA: hypothetical protein VHB20_15680 [Verrucomicrobiae bacterium]|jgi:hypothetical protein|nr:hypothetical protein [Verrucomicrobiae bacterium]
MIAWSNVVLSAMLPFVSDFATRLQLPIALPVTQSNVLACLPDQEGKVEGFVILTNDYRFWFSRGHIRRFSVGFPYRELQDPGRISKFYGEVRLSRIDAVAAAKSALHKLGLTDEQVYANFDPIVHEPDKVGTNRVARYSIEWKKPNEADFPSVEMEINATTGSPLFICLWGFDLDKADPVVNAEPPPDLHKPDWRPITAEKEKTDILSRVNPEICKTICRLDLPIATNEARTVWGVRYSRYFDGEIVFTNGYVMLMEGNTTDCRISGFAAPDAFFDTDHEIHVPAFIGTRKLTERQAEKIAKKWVALFDPTVIIDNKALITHPNLPANIIVPRCKFNWTVKGRLVAVEVDLESGGVKSLLVEQPTK